MVPTGSEPAGGDHENGEQRDDDVATPAAADRYEALVAAAPDAILVYDFDADRIVEANDAARELFGYPESAFEDLAGADLLPDDVDLSAFRAQFREALDEAPTTLSTDGDGNPLHLSTASGERVPVEISLAELALDGRRLAQAVVRDLSDRQGIVADLERAEHHLGAVAEHLPAVLFAADPDGTIVHIEGSGLERLGLAPATLRGEDLFDVFAGFDGVTTAFERAFDGEAFETTVEFGGAPFRTWFRPVRAPDGRVDRVVGLALDVTDDRRRHQLLQVLNRVLRHNLRNELNVVLGAAGMAEDAMSSWDGDGADTARQELERATAATERLLRMSDKARAVGQVESDLTAGNPHPFGEVVESACRAVASRFPDAAIDCRLPDAGAQVAAVGIDEAVEELVDNAVRHNDADTPRVTVTARLHERPGREIELVIADDGPGLSRMEREVLAAGHESPLRHSGGLGLWLVNWVVMTGGGTLDIETTDSGTTVTLRLPRSDAV